jgi:integrase
MPRRSLTDRFCQHAKAETAEVQTDYFDEAQPGLALRVFRSGAKSWMYRFTWGGKRKWLLLGTYPATGLAMARTRADEARHAIEAGRDPRSALAKPETLRAVCEEYLAREASRLRTGAARRAILERTIYPALGDRPIAGLQRSEIVRLLDQIEDTRGPAAADTALAVLRSICHWHETRSDDFRSPIVRGMSRDKSPARDRILTDDELRLVWKTAEGQGAFGRLVRFLLLTGARRTEAAAMTWSELDGSDWLLPARRNKTKVDLLRPLRKAALDVLGPKGTSPLVFTNDGVRPISGFGGLKRSFDEATGPMDRWTLHDLRRTARSLMSRAGIPSDHAERVLGHVIGGIRAVYDRHEYRDEKRDALEKLARLVDFIVHRRTITLQRVMRETHADA